MAQELNTIIFHKPAEPTANKGSYEHFGFATGDVGFPADVEMKSYSTRNVPGEDGERVFFPEVPAIDAYDWTVEFKYQGNFADFYKDFTRFRDYLIGRDGSGSRMHVYSPWSDMGKCNAYVKSIKSDKFYRKDNSVYISVKVVFRITEPNSDIKLTLS